MPRGAGARLKYQSWRQQRYYERLYGGGGDSSDKGGGKSQAAVVGNGNDNREANLPGAKGKTKAHGKGTSSTATSRSTRGTGSGPMEASNSTQPPARRPAPKRQPGRKAIKVEAQSAGAKDGPPAAQGPPEIKPLSRIFHDAAITVTAQLKAEAVAEASDDIKHDAASPVTLVEGGAEVADLAEIGG